MLAFFWHLQNSVQEKAFWCTEWTRGTGEGLLVYATRFHEALGAKNRLLVYGMDIRC